MESPDVRRRTMQAVKSKDTAPEMIVRRLAHAMGYRFRLHRQDLPGKPDLAFLGRRKVIFVHGCFWHGHDCARGARVPKNNRAYWLKKVEGNRKRDRQNLERTTAAGWKALILWECGLRDETRLKSQVRRFLEK